jgi:tRNA (guanine-N7-)-methyltransferase
LVGGRGDLRVNRPGAPPLEYPTVLRPFEGKAHLDDARAFFADQTVEIEIGFARGHFLRERIMQAPEHRFLGFEVRRRWCERMARFLEREKVSNTRVILSDARALLERLFEPNSVTAFYVFFPDPWWKKKHHKRRVISEDTLAVMARLLRPGGSIHFRTDVNAYFELASALFAHADAFEEADAAHTPGGQQLPQTHREKKCAEVGIAVQSLHFVKRAASG